MLFLVSKPESKLTQYFFFKSHSDSIKIWRTLLYKYKLHEPWNGVLRNWSSWNDMKNDACLTFCKNVEKVENSRFVNNGKKKKLETSKQE